MAQRSPFGRNEGFAYRSSGRCFRASLAVRFGRDVNPIGSCYSLRLQESTVAYADLREFVRRLEKEGELKRIRTEVDPVLEITEVVQRVMCGQQGGQAGIPVPPGSNPALLFEKPKGSRYPLLINAFGSVRRMALALEVNGLEEVAERIQGFLKMETPQGFFDKVKMLPKLAELGSFFPKSVKTGACKEVVQKGSDVNLLDCAILS